MAKLPLTYLGLNQSQIDYISTTRYAKQLQDKGWDIPNNYIPPEVTYKIKQKNSQNIFEDVFFNVDSRLLIVNEELLPEGMQITVNEFVNELLKKLSSLTDGGEQH